MYCCGDSDLQVEVNAPDGKECARGSKVSIDDCIFFKYAESFRCCSEVEVEEVSVISKFQSYILIFG